MSFEAEPHSSGKLSSALFFIDKLRSYYQPFDSIWNGQARWYCKVRLL